MPTRTADGDLVGKAVPYAAGDGATPLEGDTMAGPIRTGTGEPVGRTALYSVSGGVAQPITSLGVDPSTVGEPGGPAGPLDAQGHIPADQLPPQPLHETFEAADEATMLAAPVSAPAVCIRTDFTPAHLFYLHTDPASTLANWEDLGAGISAGDDPSAQVGLTPTNGVAATYMRSDAAPALDQSIAPAWTGAHRFTAASTEAAPSVEVASANPQLELRRTSSGTDEKRWNLVADPDQLSLRALTDAGDVADIAWLLTRSGGTVTAHSFQAGGNAYLSLSTASDIVAFVPLHMSEQKIVNLGDGSNPRDAVNKQQLDGKVAPADVVGDSPVTINNQLGVLHVALAPGSDGQALVTLGGVPQWGNQTANAVGAVATNAVGQPNGVASLGADGIVPAGQLPDAITAPADQTADATLQNQHPTVQLCDATAGAINLNLVADTPGKQFTIKKTDASANTVTISPPVPIDGQATAVLSNQYDYLTLIRGNADAWHIIAST